VHVVQECTTFDRMETSMKVHAAVHVHFEIYVLRPCIDINICLLYRIFASKAAKQTFGSRVGSLCKNRSKTRMRSS